MNKATSVRAFLQDRVFSILGFGGVELLAFLLLLAFKVDLAAITAILALFAAFFGADLAYEYWRRRRFYRALLVNLARLDQAYLVLETLDEPNFYDGQIFYEALYTINKSMHENVKIYQDESHAFREFIELWVHEVKTPLTTLSLLNRDPKAALELRRLDDLVDQVLFFSRAETAEQDYLIGKTSLANIVHQVALRSQPLLLAGSVDFATRHLDHTVYTDAKWLGFILGQIINNSVKYGATQITVSAASSSSVVTLTIADNGIGIDPKDLPRVFDKSFTGHNGRTQSASTESSTGMGLYIVKTLCDKLGHQIHIHSELHHSTTVEIVFSNHNYYLTKK